jgi:hypothetical protein
MPLPRVSPRTRPDPSILQPLHKAGLRSADLAAPARLASVRRFKEKPWKYAGFVRNVCNEDSTAIVQEGKGIMGLGREMACES